MSMRCLLLETKEILEKHGKTMQDVVWCGCKSFEIPLMDFERMANDTYNAGFGTQMVAHDLIVCGSDFWLERHEYDGKEWWEYKELPKRPKETKQVDTLFCGEGGLEWYKKKSRF